MSISRLYETEILQKIETLTNDIVNGTMSFEVYRATAAKILAYKEALVIFKDLVKNHYKDEFDDE